MSMIILYIKTFPSLPRRGSDAIMHRLGLELLSQGLRQIHGLSYPSQALEYRGNPGALTYPCSRSILLGPHGKPYLKDHPRIHFSLTNCPGLVACAFSDSEIGIDAEMPRGASPALLSRVLTEEEAKMLASSDHLSFSHLWTCKEALAKCTGLGLNSDIYRVGFRLSAAAIPPAAKYPPLFYPLLPVRFQRKDYYLAQGHLPDGHIISLCSAKVIDSIKILPVQRARQ